MPNGVVLGVIGNGRFELLQQAVASLEEKVKYPFRIKIMIDDTGDAQYALKLQETFPDWHIISHTTNQGLSGSIRSLWSAFKLLDAEYLFHVEEDFIFNQDIDIDMMIKILEVDPYLAQLALKRQPVNADEAAVGGFMQQDPHSYQLTYWAVDTGVMPDGEDAVIYQWLTHRNFFTLNPCLYPWWLIELGWEQGWGEKEFGERLFANQHLWCGYLGRVDDPPLVEHIGNYRGNNWFV